jgi:hypothetical protein
MAYTPTLRTVKGSELTWQELDDNFTDIRSDIVSLEITDQSHDARISSLETGIAGGTLSSLADVDTTAAVAGSILQYDGTNWVGGNSAVADINSIGNVDTTGVSTGQVLTFDGTNWVAANSSTGNTVNAISDLSDVDTTGVGTDNILQWNGAAWVPQQHTYARLDDVNVSSVANSSISVYDSTSSTWVATNTIDCGTF